MQGDGGGSLRSSFTWTKEDFIPCNEWTLTVQFVRKGGEGATSSKIEIQNLFKPSQTVI